MTRFAATAVRDGPVLVIFALGLSTVSWSATPPVERWIGTWAASPEAQSNAIVLSTGVTYREIVHASAGGAAVRVVVTN